MMAWEIKHIFDGDYGCEELQPGEKAKVSVTLVNEKGETKVLSVEDQWLLDKNLSEGSICQNRQLLSSIIYLHKSALHFKAHPVPVPGKKLNDIVYS